MVGTVERKRALLARAEECDRLDQIVEATRRGLSGVLVLHGEPGVGKTSLLQYVQAAGKIAILEHVFASAIALPRAGQPFDELGKPRVRSARDPRLRGSQREADSSPAAQHDSRALRERIRPATDGILNTQADTALAQGIGTLGSDY